MWSKKWKNIDESYKIKERIRENKKVDYKPLNDGTIEKYQSKSNEVYANLSIEKGKIWVNIPKVDI